MDFLLHHMLRTNARRNPGKEALVHGNRRMTYGEIARQSAGLAYGLQCAGVQRRDRIGIYLDHSIPLVLSIFGISQAGGVFVPINSLLFPDQVVHIVKDCGMKGLITTTSKLPSLVPALQEIPSVEFLVAVSDGAFPDVPYPLYIFEDLCQLSPPQQCYDAAIEKDLAALLYTSGSTGQPKGVMLSHAQILAGSSIVTAYLEITAADRILSLLPLSFDAGLNQLMTAFQQQGSLVLINFTFAREIVEILRHERITGLAGVPTLWSLLAEPSSSLQKQRLPHLRYITNTGGAMPQDVLATLRRTLPTTKIFLMYGLTEAFRSTYLPPEELDRRPTSIGKAIPNTEILVINEHGQPCRPGEVGELVHRGPTVSMGYWGLPELTARVLRPHPFVPPELGADEKVCYSGDLVRMDAEGFLYFVGRRDTMIKSSGFRISPTEVEAVLFRSGLIREAAVIGTADRMLGQSIKAFVVAKEEVDLDCEDLLAFCAERMPHYMVPKTVEELDKLPKTPSGKVDYPALRGSEGF